GWNLSQATVAGACDLAGAEIATSFGAIGATFTHPGQDALLAPGARIGSWWMERAVIDGGVNVNGALFEGAFSAVGTTVRNPRGAAIDGQSAVFQHGVVLCNGASVIGDVDFTG